MMTINGFKFGAEDYCADLGIKRSQEGLQFARSMLVNYGISVHNHVSLINI